MNLDIPLLKRLCETSGAPGFEKNIREEVLKEIKGVVDEIEIDNLGNIYALKKGTNNPDGKKVMLAAHMDEIGFMVNFIDDNGFIRFNPLGGFDPKTLTAQRVVIHGKEDIIGVMGSKPIHIMKPEERTKAVAIDDFFIDCGLPTDELKKIVSIGDPITRDRELIEMGEYVNCKSIDNRVSVFVLVEVMKSLKTVDWDIYGVFTVQEEVGIRGANVAAHRLNPDLGIAIDTTIAYDLPGSQPHEQVTSTGQGAAIKIMDAMTICDPRMVSFLKQTAEEKEIIWQPEVLTAGGTDTAGVQRMGKNGAIAGAVSIPTRYLHQVIEMAHTKDIQAAIDLLVTASQKISTYNWK